MGCLCVVMAFGGDRLLTLLYGRQYAGNSLVVALLALNLLVTSATFSFSRALFAIGRANTDFLVNFAALFIMLTLGLGLVRHFGPRGAAIGMVGASLLTSIVRVGAFLWLSRSHCSDTTSRVNEL
jgi:O-antigen/teichoic acid export membrane protein